MLSLESKWGWRLALCLIIVLLVGGVAIIPGLRPRVTPENVGLIQIGMTGAEVDEILGPPTERHAGELKTSEGVSTTSVWETNEIGMVILFDEHWKVKRAAKYAPSQKNPVQRSLEYLRESLFWSLKID